MPPGGRGARGGRGGGGARAGGPGAPAGAGGGSVKLSQKGAPGPAGELPHAYDPRRRTLLVGEGNFSFARALVRLFAAEGENLVATAFDSEELAVGKYPDAAAAVEEVQECGGRVLFGVDARDLGGAALARLRPKGVRGRKGGGGGAEGGGGRPGGAPSPGGGTPSLAGWRGSTGSCSTSPTLARASRTRP